MVLVETECQDLEIKRMKKPHILLIFQNAYSNHRGRNIRFKSPTYGIQWINRKNATYSRVIPYLESHFEISMSECTPKLARNKNDKFETDLAWVQSALTERDWFAVITFSKQAEQAIVDLNYNAFAMLPHPVSWAWRKHMIEELTEKLITKNQNVN